MSNILAGKWSEIKGKVRAAWGKLTDDDVEQVKGKKTYRYDKTQGQKEIDNFKKSLT